jgi:hypothetical protein
VGFVMTLMILSSLNTLLQLLMLHSAKWDWIISWTVNE